MARPLPTTVIGLDSIAPSQLQEQEENNDPGEKKGIPRAK